MPMRFVIDALGVWTGEAIDWDETDPIPPRTILDTPPTLAAGEMAVWAGGWTVAVEPPEVSTPIEAPAVLPALTRRRLRLALLSIDIRSADVEAVINAIPDVGARDWAMVEWQDAGEYERRHPLLLDLQQVFDLPDLHVDTLWVWAAGL